MFHDISDLDKFEKIILHLRKNGNLFHPNFFKFLKIKK